MCNNRSQIALRAMIMIGIFGCIAALAQEQDTEVRIARKDLPAPVEQAVREQSKGAIVRGFAREVKSGETFYEVELSVNGLKERCIDGP